ncbi:hypothetical protein [Streptomyces sp. NPDC096105]|uniref:hypothetical protein n=1 Tax=Streptomyces sp. NPDC096105 TaxID=3366074 RepID=UPI0038064E80
MNLDEMTMEQLRELHERSNTELIRRQCRTYLEQGGHCMKDGGDGHTVHEGHTMAVGIVDGKTVRCQARITWEMLPEYS